MEKNINIFPEACYTLKNLSFSDVQKSFKRNETIVGLVKNIRPSEKTVYVELGEGLIAYLPFSEATIYPFTYSTNSPTFPFPLQIACLKDKIICVKIKEINGNKIILSRKANMLEAYEVIKEQKYLPFNVTATRAKAVFGDVGHGIQAKINIFDLCKSRIRSTSELCKPGDSFSVEVLNFDELKRVNVSYKNTFTPYKATNYKTKDVVVGCINEPIDNNFTGFFVHINPQVVGILDYNPYYPSLQYGDIVECSVYKTSDRGLHLRFLNHLGASK